MDHTVRAWDLDTQQCTVNLGEDLSLARARSLARTLLSLCLGLGSHRLLGLYKMAFSPKRSLASRARARSLALSALLVFCSMPFFKKHELFRY
jgi:hypothetical protein